jgi:micrococcal nuclease
LSRARPYRAASWKPWLAPLVVCALVVLLRLWWSVRGTPPAPAARLLAEGEYAVARVVDGDTLELAGGAMVRLLGVDTPETVAPNRPVEPWGPEAAEFTRAFIAGRPVRLSFDFERHDRYGRHLAYVWRESQLLNEELIRAGLTEAITVFPYAQAMKDRFRAAQREAKNAKRGIWSTPAGATTR